MHWWTWMPEMRAQLMSAAETELIEQARRGDRSALERLLIDHAGQLRIHLQRGLPTRVNGLISIDDVVQETLTRAFLKVEQLRGDFAQRVYGVAAGDRQHDPD